MKLFRAATAALVLGGMVLGVGMPAMADWGDGGRRGGMEVRGGAQHRFLGPEVLGSLDLTQEQKAEMWDLFQNRRVGRRNRDEDSKVRELREQIRSGQAVGLGLKTEAEKEIADHIMERQESMTKLYGILTSEQRAKAEAAFEECREQGDGHFGQRAERPRRGGEKGCRDRDPLMGRMADELDLTDGQKAQIAEIVKESRGLREDHREDLREMGEEHRQMMQMAWTASPDMNKMREAAEKAAADRVELMMQGGETMKKIRSVLTGEQLKKLETCREDWQGRGHFGVRGQRHNW